LQIHTQDPEAVFITLYFLLNLPINLIRLSACSRQAFLA
jgi:hypothetical protein